MPVSTIGIVGAGVMGSGIAQVAATKGLDVVMVDVSEAAVRNIGPLALAEMIGLDVLLSVMQIIHDEFADSKYRSCALLKELVAAGRLGRKCGHGVYSY